MSKKPTNKSSKKSASKPAGGVKADLAHLESILELMAKHGVAELDWDQAGTRLHLRTAASFASAPAAQAYAPVPVVAPAPVAAPASAPQAAPAAASAPAKAAPAANANLKQVLSPFVGTFYRAGSPGAPAYAKEGQVVKAGDALCIVEAMKLMNEIESEFNGKIHSVLVENGSPVEFGEPLFTIEI